MSQHISFGYYIYCINYLQMKYSCVVSIPQSSICLMSLQGRKDQEYLLTTNKEETQSSPQTDIAQLKFLSFMGNSSHILRDSNQVFIPNTSSSTFNLFAK